MAIYRCDWRWHADAAARPPQERDQMFGRVFMTNEAADAIGAQRLLDWYSFPGQAAGFLLIDAATHEELAQILRPYTELMSFAIQPVVRVDYAQARRRFAGGAGG